MSKGYVIKHIGEDEFAELHEIVAATHRMAGLKGAALDKAIAKTFRATLIATDAERDTDQRRRNNIRLVAVDGKLK